MPEKVFRLVTLGRLALCAPRETPVAVLDELNARRRKIALLAVLALRARPVSRDTLLEMFWGGQDETRARHSLSDAVSHLRRVLGREAIVASRAELSLAERAHLIVDARELAELASQPSERRRAIALYAGRFMDGVYVSDSASWEHWVSGEQARLERIFVEACKHECTSLLARGEASEGATIAERWLDAEPLSEEAALTLLNALARSTGADGEVRALAAYERLDARLAREYDSAPGRAVADWIAERRDRLRSRTQSAPTEVAVAERFEPANPNSVESPRAATGGAQPATAKRARSRWRTGAWLGAAAALVIVAGWVLFDTTRPNHSAATPPRNVLAVAELVSASSDSSSKWLVDALPQMIAAKVARSPDVDVVPAAELRALRARSQTVGKPLSAGSLQELGRRSGATLVASGAFMERDGKVVLELRLTETRTGRVSRFETIADSSVLALVDRAAVRLLDAAGASSDGPSFSEIETASLGAYQHFVRWYQLGFEHPTDATAELDAAVALDSGFTSAVLARVIQAMAENDGATTARLTAVLRKNDARIPERDRLEWESRVRFRDGDIDRSEALARMLVQRYPRDPRGYQLLSMIYELVGRWDAEERVLERMLALDSLGMEAGRGPCVACYGLGSLTVVRLFRGDWSGAERVARRWTTLTPELHLAWTNLALAQAYHGEFERAAVSAARALALAPAEPSVRLTWAWIKLMSRDLDGAERELDSWERSDSRTMRALAIDVRTVIQRERGQFRLANATLERAMAEFPELSSLELVHADGLARTGKCGEAVAAFEAVHGRRAMTEDPAPGGASRAYAWHHALLADVVARSRSCDGAAPLTALADSIERIARRSYYGRDWTLHHHVRGLIAERAGDYALAESEFRMAQWRISDGWNRSMSALGEVQLARGKASEAIDTFRKAYASRPDAMGRYQPRSELDYYMALAFRQAGMVDSAAVYEGYVRRAWANADPETKLRLRVFDAPLVRR